jgi:hypothetical protein
MTRPARPWSPKEDDVILNGPPSAKLLQRLLPNRTTNGINDRRGVLGLGKSRPRAPRWSAKEDKMVRRWYPDQERLARLMPHRTREAISGRAGDLRLTRRIVRFSAAELGRLAKLAHLTGPALAAEFPNHSIKTLYFTRRLIAGIRPKVVVVERPNLVGDIRRRAFERGLRLERLAKHCQLAQSSERLGRSPAPRQVPTYIAYFEIVKKLGGEIYAEWED